MQEELLKEKSRLKKGKQIINALKTDYVIW